jgi:hypothetical protein
VAPKSLKATMHTASPGYESECIRGPIVVDPKAGQVEQHTRNLAEIAAALFEQAVESVHSA